MVLAAKEARASRRRDDKQLREYVHTLELHLDQACCTRVRTRSCHFVARSSACVCFRCRVFDGSLAHSVSASFTRVRLLFLSVASTRGFLSSRQLDLRCWFAAPFRRAARV